MATALSSQIAQHGLLVPLAPIPGVGRAAAGEALTPLWFFPEAHLEYGGREPRI